MAFDQNLVPKDLRPLNVARSVADEPRIAPATTTGRTGEGFAPNPAKEACSPHSMPIFYPAGVPDTGFAGLNYGNAPPAGLPAWFTHGPVPVAHMSVNPHVGFSYNPALGNRVVVNAVDQTTNEAVLGFENSPYLGNRVVGAVGDQAGSENAGGMGSGSNLVNRPAGSGAEQVVCDLQSSLGQKQNVGRRGSGNGTDQASEEGGEESVSGKKVKFLCSFGGKIMPRPSDGMLRYVGGQTRIICVRRNVSFNDLVRKMVDTYGQPVVIKYQLPDEDLDALVSVSCPDDLENMMDEYEKLVEKSLDGSAKLRVFLFSASELDSSSTFQYGDLHDGGQRYVEAVNGLMDGNVGGITRKESIASVASTPNSDISCNEVVDSSIPSQGDGNMTPSMGTQLAGSTSASDTSKLLFVDQAPTPCTDNTTAGYSIPAVKTDPSQIPSPQQMAESDKSLRVPTPQQPLAFNTQQPGMGIPPSAPYMQVYMEPRKENITHADYAPLPPLMGYPNPNLLGTVSSVCAPQQFVDSAASHNAPQVFAPVHMTLHPAASHAGVRPAMVQPLIHPHQSQRLEHEGASGQRVVFVPVEQSRAHHTYKVPITQPVVSAGYGWPSVYPPAQVVVPDGSVPHHPDMLADKSQRLEDCYMCQKALPHAHSDTVIKDQNASSSIPSPDSNLVYHSLQLDDMNRPLAVNKVMVGGAVGVGCVEPGTAVQSAGSVHVGMLTQDQGQRENERTANSRTDNLDPKLHMVGPSSTDFSPYGVLLGDNHQSGPEKSMQQSFVPTQLKQDGLVNKPVTADACIIGGIPIQTSEYHVCESPKEHSNISGFIDIGDNMESTSAVDHVKPVDGRMESLRISAPEIISNIDQSRSPVDELSDAGTFKQKIQRFPGEEMLVNTAYNKPKFLPETVQVTTTDVPTYSAQDISFLQDLQRFESHEVAQPSILGIPKSNSQSKLGVPLEFEGVYYGGPALSGFGTVNVTPITAQKEDTALLHPQVVPSDVDSITMNGNISSYMPPTSRMEDVQDSSNSLFMQDPPDFHYDAHFPPPKPIKLAVRKEAIPPRDPLVDNHLGKFGERCADIQMEEGGKDPFSIMPNNLIPENLHSSKGSAEERIKQELQNVAEGVAASVLHSSFPSNPDLPAYEMNEPAHEAREDREKSTLIEMNSQAANEDTETKLKERVNFGFPVSDGIGRLQIIKNSDLEELRELGSGTYGTVYHGKWRGTDVAIKRINDRCFSGKPSEQERMRNDFWNEAIKLADLHHPNVVAFYGVVVDGPEDSVATVTEYMVNGSLRTALQKNERNLDKRKRLLIAMDVAFGMEYLHSKNIVHFDLKSDNLLVNLRDPHRPICKVGDLGLSKVKCQTLISGGVRGTLPWMAPELLNGSSSLVSEKVDVFSFGIVMWELLTGDEPYADLHYGAIIGGIVNNTLRPLVPESCDPEWRSLMERCWSSEPSERPSFTETANELRSMAAKIPAKTPSHS